ncbi:MAG: sigma factor-like helix-turn-helix DNA-binding protein [Flavobacteriaceae bacterium]
MPPKCQKVFKLHKLEGLTIQETAEYLNISLKTVENQMSKAYKVLRKAMQGIYHSTKRNIFIWMVIPSKKQVSPADRMNSK